MTLRTSFIKTFAIGLAVACTFLFAESSYMPNQYQQDVWSPEYGSSTWMYENSAGIFEMGPLDDYYAAKRLFLNRQFLDAAYAFGNIQTMYPAFHLVDQAAFYMAKSFENLLMHKAAREIYRDAIKRYPQSDQLAKYHFQLMNIDYKEGKYEEAMNKYQYIVQKFGKSDAKADADYVAGQIKLEQGLYQESIDLHASIPPGNANYLYARYTMGIASSRMHKWNEAENCFRDITEQQVSNKSERDIQNAAKVKLGHLLFSAEKPDIAAAARMYGLVQKDSPVFDEAMLGIAYPEQSGRKILLDSSLRSERRCFSQQICHCESAQHPKQSHVSVLKSTERIQDVLTAQAYQAADSRASASESHHPDRRTS